MRPALKEMATVKQIRHTMKELNLDIVKYHFTVSDISDDCTNDNVDEIEPFVVCDGVSIDVFNQYINGGNLRIALRFLELSTDGRLLIVEYPSSIHEITVRVFELALSLAWGDSNELGTRGSMTAHRNALSKQSSRRNVWSHERHA